MKAELEDLKTEFEAVSRLLELEERRLANIPVTSAPAPKPQPRVQSPSLQHTPVHQQMHGQSHPQQHLQSPPQQHTPVHQQLLHGQSHAQPHVPQSQPHMHQPQPQPQPQQLADFLVRQLSEAGAMSRDDLRRLALQEGYFNDADSAERGVHAALVSVNKAGLIRQLPNGNFAQATVLDTIRLRRAI